MPISRPAVAAILPKELEELLSRPIFQAYLRLSACSIEWEMFEDRKAAHDRLYEGRSIWDRPLDASRWAAEKPKCTYIQPIDRKKFFKGGYEDKYDTLIHTLYKKYFPDDYNRLFGEAP